MLDADHERRGSRLGPAVIRDGGADLVLLQETTPAWERALRAPLLLRYPYMAFEPPHHWTAGGMAVLSTRQGAALQHALERDMANALPLFEPDAVTWRWPVGNFTARARLDHILYQPSHHGCFDARVVQAGRSDHLPVVASFCARLLRTPNRNPC